MPLAPTAAVTRSVPFHATGLRPDSIPDEPSTRALATPAVVPVTAIAAATAATLASRGEPLDFLEHDDSPFLTGMASAVNTKNPGTRGRPACG